MSPTILIMDEFTSTIVVGLNVDANITYILVIYFAMDRNILAIKEVN